MGEKDTRSVSEQLVITQTKAQQGSPEYVDEFVKLLDMVDDEDLDEFSASAEEKCKELLEDLDDFSVETMLKTGLRLQKLSNTFVSSVLKKVQKDIVEG